VIDAPFNAIDSLEKYPKIVEYGRGHGGLACVGFEKHDGTNLAVVPLGEAPPRLRRVSPRPFASDFERVSAKGAEVLRG
jgi:hypothetical protein